jgi:hypothetical protein
MSISLNNLINKIVCVQPSSIIEDRYDQHYPRFLKTEVVLLKHISELEDRIEKLEEKLKCLL